MDPSLQQQFIAAYDEYADAIYRHCYFRVFDKGKAEELAQETFMKTWQYLAAGHLVDNLRPFLYRVASNLVVDYVRKRKEHSLDATLEDHPQHEPASEAHLDLDRTIQLRDLAEALEQLSQEQRDLVVMRYVDDLDPKDIAELLGITPNHVSVKLNRAVRALRSILNPDS